MYVMRVYMQGRASALCVQATFSGLCVYVKCATCLGYVCM